jgi:hypothetical protein
MMCPYCRDRINIQESQIELVEPRVFGAYADNPIVITHESEYRCKCGKTKVVFEGYMQEYASNGCILSPLDSDSQHRGE